MYCNNLVDKFQGRKTFPQLILIYIQKAFIQKGISRHSNTITCNSILRYLTVTISDHVPYFAYWSTVPYSSKIFLLLNQLNLKRSDFSSAKETLFLKTYLWTGRTWLNQIKEIWIKLLWIFYLIQIQFKIYIHF